MNDPVKEGIAAVLRGEPIPVQAKPLVERPPPPRTDGKIHFNPEKAEEWNDRWEKRFAPGYVTREEDARVFPKPKVKPPPVRDEQANTGEPVSAEVIREIEAQINGGKVYSEPGYLRRKV